MSSVKKTTTKKTVAKVAPTHPKFIEMIKQCIIDTKEDSRIGVSRPQIKHYLASHYKLDMSSKANIGHLNRGISQGTTDEIFVLPKGISGRVKLNKVPAGDKENVKPTSTSKPASVKAPAAAAKAPVKKAAPAAKKAAAPAAKKAAPKKAAAPAAKKAAPVKKATVTKKAAPVAKKTATKTKSSTSKAATATKAKAAPKKAVAKKAPAAKPKAAAAKKAAPKKKVAAKK